MGKDSLVSRIMNGMKSVARNSTLLVAVGAVGIGGLANKSQAETYNTTPGENFSWTQDAIEDPKYDTINWTSGSYSVPHGLSYDVYPNKTYTIEADTVISGSGFEHGMIFHIKRGGDITLSGGKGATLQNANRGIWIGETAHPAYENINISGLTFNNMADCGILYMNIPNYANPPNAERADIVVSSCTVTGGIKFISQYHGGNPVNQFSPYASALNNDVTGLSQWMMDTPKAEIPSLDSKGYEIVILGGKDGEIVGNIVDDCPALSLPNDYFLASASPGDNVYSQYVSQPFMIASEIDPSGPFYGSEEPYLIRPIPTGVKDNKGNFVTFFGDANFDGTVDGADYTIWADNYHLSGTWRDGDFNNDDFVDGADYTLWADNFGWKVEDYPYPTGGGGSVPEPFTSALILAGAAIALSRRRKKTLAEVVDN